MPVIEFTDEALRHVRQFLEQEEDELAVRIRVVDSSPLAPRYDLSLVDESERGPDDRVLELDGFEVVVDPESATLLEGATVDWVESMQGSGFKVENPNIRPIGSGPADGPVAERVRHVLEYQVNPSIAAHGGHVSLVEVRDGVAYLEMSGGCQGCGMAAATLQRGIKRILTEAVPEIRDIADVTNHAAGTNPYYS